MRTLFDARTPTCGVGSRNSSHDITSGVISRGGDVIVGPTVTEQNGSLLGR